MSLVFNQSWSVNGIPTGATSATIGIYDDTAAAGHAGPVTARILRARHAAA